MFEALTEKIDQAIRTLTGKARLTEANLAEVVKDIRRALVDADVNYKIAKEFTERVKEQALGQEVIKSITPGQLFIKILHDELVKLLGGNAEGLRFASLPPTIYLIIGLNGAGKTTFSAKLARWVRSRGRAPFLVGADLYRPAAMEQLKVLAEKIEVPYYIDPQGKEVTVLARQALQQAKEKSREVVIFDTAGRQTPDTALMEELIQLKKSLNPQEILLVVDAMTGQDAVQTALAFDQVVGITGVILSKMDGDTRGGAALSIKAATGKPIKFISTGEKPEDLDAFYPERIASRILGMGDIVSFVEKAQAAYDAEKAQKLQEKLAKNKFDFEDLLEQLRSIRKMGNLKELIALIPGMAKQIKDTDLDERSLKHVEAIILSMTPQERRNPLIINGSRRRRIAQGSGTSIQQVNQLLREYEQMKKMLRSVQKFQNQGRDPKLAHPLFRKK
ncbi:MAG: signal recognition particle protein [Bacteroidia bacterium]